MWGPDRRSNAGSSDDASSEEEGLVRVLDQNSDGIAQEGAASVRVWLRFLSSAGFVGLLVFATYHAFRTKDSTRVLHGSPLVSFDNDDYAPGQAPPPNLLNSASPSAFATPPPLQSQCIGRTAQLWQTAPNAGEIGVFDGPHIIQETPISQPDSFVTERLPTIEVQLRSRDQEIVGFGGAFTESAATVFSSLGADLQEQVLEQYFGAAGLGFTLGRVHINSCDFSTSSYSFDDTPNDWNLTNFDTSVARDATQLIPLIQRAMRKVAANGHDLKLLASPWSPPAWMKVNGEMDHSNRPGLRPECRWSWAKYFNKWIAAYKGHNVPIWAVTVQNEPEADQTWDSCVYSAAEEAEFLGNFLGPALRGAFPDIKIFAFDHNKDHIVEWTTAMAQHENASRYLDGVAFHWYAGDFFENVATVHRTHPEALLLASEATYEISHFQPPGSKTPNGGWVLGEGYAHDIIGDLNAGAIGWIDWNLMLDGVGGPNHVGNMCEAPLIIKDGQVNKHEQYWFIGHFSKFILPGSVRLISQVLDAPRYEGPVRPYGACTSEDGLEATAFLRPDNQVVVVALNCGDRPFDFAIRLGQHATEKPAVRASIPAHAIQTYVFPQQCAGPGQSEILRRAIHGLEE